MVRRGPDQARQRLPLRDPPAAGGASADMIADCGRRIRIELTIDVGIQVALDVLAAHGSFSIGVSSFSSASSRSRPRARRDITVPIGTPTTAAISL